MASRTKTSTADKAESRRELAALLHASITDKVAELTSSDTWRAYLDHVASFHSYSAGSVGVSESVNALHRSGSTVGGVVRPLAVRLEGVFSDGVNVEPQDSREHARREFTG